MRDSNFASRTEFIKDIREQGGDERVTFIYEKQPYQLVEESLNTYLNDLARRGIGTLAITARRTGRATKDQKTTVQETTHNIIERLGIQFKTKHFQDIKLSEMNQNNAKYKDHIVDKRGIPFADPGDAMIEKNVLFTNNIDKVVVLNEIFIRTNFFPKTIVLIDDTRKNLESIEEAIRKINENSSKSNIQFKGYLYTGAQQIDDTINPHVVSLQKEYLLRKEPIFLTDEQAMKIIGDNI